MNSSSFICWKVLIVPLWNWNWWRDVGFTPPPLVLIVPLWNWNRRNQGAEVHQRNSSNRTFMELKSHNNFEWSLPCWSSNRTFMELKLQKSLLLSIGITVLIVPLWNWNVYQVKVGEQDYGSNRTFMELKCTTRRSWTQRSDSSNRTFMELKWKRAVWKDEWERMF